MPGSKDHNRHTIWLDPEHFPILQEMYPGHSVSAIIRLILDEHIAMYRPKTETPIPAEIQLDDS